MTWYNKMVHSSKSSEYDAWHQSHVGDSDLGTISLASWHENVLSLLPPLEGVKLLEVGCGRGDFALHLARQGAHVTAVDFSPRAIELARARAESLNIPVCFQVADAQALPFAEGSFDLVVSCECLEHVPSPSLVLSEIHRVLRTSGKVILTTENYSNALLLNWAHAWLRKQPINSGERQQPIEHFFVYWYVVSLFSKAGLRVIRRVGSHHVFLMLPRFHPHTFVKERFANPLWARLFRPFARHMAFEAIKE